MSFHTSVGSKESGLLPQDNLDSIEKMVVRKLDYIRLIPFAFIIILLHQLEGAALGQASVLGLLHDTNITLKQYGLIAALGSLGELVSQVPHAFFLQRFSAAKYLGVLVNIWGIILSLSAVATNFSQLVALRFGLGLFGSGVYPCCSIIIARMYRKREQNQRLGVIIYANGVAVSVGGIFGYGVGHMNGVGGLHSWQWIMLIYGSVTIFCGICCFFFMIDDPKTNILRPTPEVKKVIDMRIADNGVTESRKMNYNHIKESLKEPRYYCYIISIILVHLQNGALKAFGQILVLSFGFSELVSLLLKIPEGLYIMVTCFLGLCFVDRFGNRHYTACISFGGAVLGLLLLIILPIQQAKLAGLCLSLSYTTGHILLISSVTNNVMGSTKKIFYLLSITAAGVIGDFIGPLMMTHPQQPLVAIVAYIVSDVVAIVLVLFARYTMSKSNKKRLGDSFIQVEHKEDPTDRDIIDFIYKL